MSKVIIFNMTPRSGKDTAVDYLHEKFGWPKLSFKEKVIEVALSHYGITQEEWDERYNKWDEELGWYKDLQWNRLATGTRCLSQREALIHISEEVIKPTFGNGIFGKAVSDEIGFEGIYLISDGGFDDELYEIVDFEHEVLIIKRDRLGLGWEGDSRGWLDCNLPSVTERWVPEEVEEVEEYLEFVGDTIFTWMSENTTRPPGRTIPQGTTGTSQFLSAAWDNVRHNHTINNVFN